VAAGQESGEGGLKTEKRGGNRMTGNREGGWRTGKNKEEIGAQESGEEAGGQERKDRWLQGGRRLEARKGAGWLKYSVYMGVKWEVVG
jgi:hypothetical protein